MGRNKSLVLNEDHPVIQGILTSNSIRNETRLLALADLNHLERTKKLWPHADSSEDVDELFEWEDSELGSSFWSKIQDKVFEPEKRTC